MTSVVSVTAVVEVTAVVVVMAEACGDGCRWVTTVACDEGCS